MGIEGVRISRTNEDVKEFLMTCSKALAGQGWITIGFSVDLKFAAASTRRVLTC